MDNDQIPTPVNIPPSMQPAIQQPNLEDSSGNFLSRLIPWLKSKQFVITIFTTATFFIIFVFTIPWITNAIALLLFSGKEYQNAGLAGFAFLLISMYLGVILYAFANGLTIYFFLRKIKTFFIGFFLFLLIVFIYLRIQVYLGEQYLNNQYNQVNNRIEETVGKDPIIITYATSTPIYDSDAYVYDSNDILTKLNVVFDVMAPETGEYQFDGYLSTHLYNEKSPIMQDPDANARVKATLTKGNSTKVSLEFDMASFVSTEYSGDVKLNFSVWRTNLNIKDVDYHKEPITSYPINVKDSGKSNNYIVSNRRGTEEPVYIIGSFSLTNPNPRVTPPPEIVHSKVPSATWKEFADNKVSFFYPQEWVVQKYDINKLGQNIQEETLFYTADQVSKSAITAFRYATYQSTVPEHIKILKSFNKDLQISSVKIAGKLGTKLVDPKKYSTQEDPIRSRKEISILIPINENSFWLFAGDKETIYDVLSTLKFK